MLDGFPQWWLELLWEKTQFACRQVLLPCVSMWVNLTDDWTFVETAAKILRILEGILRSIKDIFWSNTSLLYLGSLFTCLILFFSCMLYEILFITRSDLFTKSKSIEFVILIICYMVFLFENIAAWYFFCILLSARQHVQSLKSAQTLIRKEKVLKIILLPLQCVQFFLLLQTCSALKTLISDVVVANKSCLQSLNLPWLHGHGRL